LPEECPVGAKLPYAPLVRSQPLWGRTLRHAALAVLLAAGRPLSPGEVLGRLEAMGFTVAGPRAGKRLANALAHEVARGRLRRPARGRYATAAIPKVTASRVRRRLRDAVDDLPGGQWPPEST
jgi:hypothetical protein